MTTTKKPKLSQRNRVLNALTKAGDAVSAKSIASTARVPYASVSKRIHDLRLEGYKIATDVRTTKTGPKTMYELA